MKCTTCIAITSQSSNCQPTLRTRYATTHLGVNFDSFLPQNFYLIFNIYDIFGYIVYLCIWVFYGMEVLDMNQFERQEFKSPISAQKHELRAWLVHSNDLQVVLDVEDVKPIELERSTSHFWFFRLFLHCLLPSLEKNTWASQISKDKKREASDVKEQWMQHAIQMYQ